MRVNFLAERDYSHGYQKCLTDIKNWFERHSETLKYNRLLNTKGINELLSAMESNAELMEKYGEDTEFGFSVEDKKLKIYAIGEKRDYE